MRSTYGTETVAKWLHRRPRSVWRVDRSTSLRSHRGGNSRPCLGLLGLGAARARGDEGWGQGLGRRGLGAARAWGGGGLGRRGLGAARACLVVEVTSKTKKTIQQRSKTKKTKTKSPAKQRNLRGRHEGCGFLHPHGFGNQRVSNHKHYPRPRRWTLGAALSATSQMDAWAALSATSQMDAAALSATSQMDADTLF